MDNLNEQGSELDAAPTTVSEVTIIPIRATNGLVAFASCVIDNKLHLGGIGIYTKLEGEGYRLTYPNKKVGKNAIKLAYPINKEVGEAILNAISSEYEKLLTKDL
ncbi:hypothetical protein EPO05_07395 [Patescibacteria group bacterium]|nr:MAG: hypothetical protein EPO05_07395 [Patescibacteria group bacterium]